MSEYYSKILPISLYRGHRELKMDLFTGVLIMVLYTLLFLMFQKMMQQNLTKDFLDITKDLQVITRQNGLMNLSETDKFWKIVLVHSPAGLLRWDIIKITLYSEKT